MKSHRQRAARRAASYGLSWKRHDCEVVWFIAIVLLAAIVDSRPAALAAVIVAGAVVILGIELWAAGFPTVRRRR
jgi:hypothetical protein